MGVPKFFRWLSERYPKINQRFGSPPDPETSQDYFGKPPPEPFEQPDPLSTCGLAPEIDRLYLDMNGILHGCSHNNNGSSQGDDGGAFATTNTSGIQNEQIFTNVCYYLDRVIGDMVQPKQVVYMAIDGVAPRAKLNQQRSRRYRSGTEGQIETNIYDAHVHSLREKQQQQKDEQNASGGGVVDDGYSFVASNNDDDDDEQDLTSDDDSSDPLVQEISPGRFKGKFQTQAQLDADQEAFHSNVITPGTPFFQAFTKHLEHFVKHKLSTDPKWKDLTIIFSGPNVPGEGEHKIMQFIRQQKQRPDYDANLRHCIMGQDGDLVMLGLATHEPNMVLLRERVIFNMTKRRLMDASTQSLDAYIHNPHFEFLHMGVLRDYLAYEFETSNVIADAPWDLERVLDDFVFMTFTVGNDFLPHMPALDIADNAFDLLFYTYKQCRKEWLEECQESGDGDLPYLTHEGNIVSGSRLEHFLSEVGGHELSYYDKKKQSAPKDNQRMRKESKRFGTDSTIPDDDVLKSKEDSDRAAYRQMLQRQLEEKEAAAANNGQTRKFTPVLSERVELQPIPGVEFQPIQEDLEEGLISRMSSLLQNSLSNEDDDDDDDDASRYALRAMDDQDLKGRYYYDKFQFTPFDAEKHQALRKAYMEGLVWNLKYYYQGCVSWEWYYPYHYGPMLSDLVNLDELLGGISFDENLGAPLKPFEQLMGCMPPSQAHHLPEPYRWLMTDPASPIIDFYPKTFTIDMNGKRWPWEAVALLPFIDSGRLLEVAGKVDDSMLLEEERERNATGTTVVMMHDPEYAETVPGIGKGKVFETIEENKTRVIPFDVSDWNYKSEEVPVLKAQLAPDVTVPLSGFGSLRDGPVQSLWRRKMGINVFGSRSRYKTACLEISKFMPPLPPIEALGPKLIGTCIYVNYPYFIEGFVTAVSDENVLIRGKNEPRRWTSAEAERWQISRDGVTGRYETGEGYTGTGGVTIPEDQTILLSVRPFEGLVTAKDGTQVKSYAKFEIEVPLISSFWVPSHPDPRLSAVPSRLEKNPFDVATPIHKIGLLKNKNSADSKPRKLFPSKTRKSSLFEPSNLQTAQGGLTESSPFNSPTARAYSADQSDRPEEIVASTASLLPDGHAPPLAVSSTSAEQMRIKLSSRLRQGAVTSRKFSSVHTPDDRDMFLDAQAVVSRFSNIDFATKINTLESLPRTVLRGLASVEHTRQATPAIRQCPSTAPHSNTSRLHSSHPSAAALRGGNSRVRILAVGAATAAFFFSSAGASGMLPSLFGCKRVDTKAALVSGRFQASEPFFPGPEDLMDFDIVEFVGDILSVRGGDFEKSEDALSSTPPLEFAHGTTTISFTFKDGIVAAVDSRASMGSFVGSKTTQKVLPVNSHMLGTMAGGAADCMFWIRKVKAEAMQHELSEGRRMSVARASRILSNFLYQNRGVGLSMGTMIMGFDQDGPPRIYYVDDTGVRIEGSQFAVGSGASFALGILDTERREEMTEEEAVALGIKAVRHATFRDAYSGGFINVFVITKDGWRKVFTEDLARTSQITRDDGIHPPSVK